MIFVDMLGMEMHTNTCVRVFVGRGRGGVGIENPDLPAGKGLTSWLSFVVSAVSLSLFHWYPGSGVVLDCINS